MQPALLLLLALNAPAWADEPKLDPAQAYQAWADNAVTYDVDFVVVVTAPYHTKLLKVRLPLPPSDNAQKYKRTELSTFSLMVEPKFDTEKTYGNQFAYFEFANPEGAQQIRHRFTITVSEL